MAVGGAYYFVGQTVGGTVPGNTTFGGNVTVGGQILAADGTVSAPAHSFANHTNSGLYWNSTSGSMSISSNGVIAATITPTPINDANLAYQANATNTNPAYFAMNRNGASYGALFGFDFTIGGGGAIVRSVNSADSVLFITNNSTIAAKFNPSGQYSTMMAAVTAKTSNYSLAAVVSNTANDSATTLTNTGAAGAVQFTLPTSPTLGYTATFAKTTNQTLTVTVGGSDKIVIGGVTGTLNTIATLSTLNGSMTLQYVATNTWQATSLIGTATLN